MSGTPEPEWIRCQYFAFWDVPRALVIAHQGKSFLLDSPFEEEEDEYRPSYLLWEIEETSQEMRDTLTWPELELRNPKQLNDLPFSALRFAPNRERSNGRFYVWVQIVDPSLFIDVTGD